MPKDKYLKVYVSKFKRDFIVSYEDKFEELLGFLKLQFYSDKISPETYSYIYNLVFDMIEIFYNVGGVDYEKENEQNEGSFRVSQNLGVF